MTCCQCEGIEHEFDETFARNELKRYRKKGLRKTSQILVDAVHRQMNGAETLLDIGGGVGGIQLELLNRGVGRATSVDASTGFIEAAREEADRAGVTDRIDQHHGDFLDAAESIVPADIVTLDRVVCCYHDMPALVGTSSSRARRLYGVVYPRDAWWMRLSARGTNLWFRIRKSPMRTFIHSTREVEAVLRREGFDRTFLKRTPLWQIAVYRRAEHVEASPSPTSPHE